MNHDKHKLASRDWNMRKVCSRRVYWYGTDVLSASAMYGSLSYIYVIIIPAPYMAEIRSREHLRSRVNRDYYTGFEVQHDDLHRWNLIIWIRSCQSDMDGPRQIVLQKNVVDQL